MHYSAYATLLAAAAAFMLLLGHAAAAAAPGFDATNVTWHGFKILSNVSGHLYISKDACEIGALLLDTAPPVNFSAAMSIFLNGKHSVRADGKTPRKLVSWTSGAHATGHPYYSNGSALYNDPAWVTSFWNASVSPTAPNAVGRAVMATHTAKLQIPLIYMLAELYAIEDEIDPNGTTIDPTGVFSGAPHALDEAFGVYAGIASECAPWAYVEAGAAAFGTRANCTISKANKALIEALRTAQAATINGSVPSYVAARAQVFTQLHVALVQNVLASSSAADKAAAKAAKAAKAAAAAVAAAAAADDALAAAKAEAYTLTRALAPMVHQVDPAAAKSLLSLVDPAGTVSYTKVAAALKALYTPLGIKLSQVGTLGAKDKACTKP